MLALFSCSNGTAGTLAAERRTLCLSHTPLALRAVQALMSCGAGVCVQMALEGRRRTEELMRQNEAEGRHRYDNVVIIRRPDGSAPHLQVRAHTPHHSTHARTRRPRWPDCCCCVPRAGVGCCGVPHGRLEE